MTYIFCNYYAFKNCIPPAASTRSTSSFYRHDNFLYITSPKYTVFDYYHLIKLLRRVIWVWHIAYPRNHPAALCSGRHLTRQILREQHT